MISKQEFDERITKLLWLRNKMEEADKRRRGFGSPRPSDEYNNLSRECLDLLDDLYKDMTHDICLICKRTAGDTAKLLRGELEVREFEHLIPVLNGPEMPLPKEVFTNGIYITNFSSSSGRYGDNFGSSYDPYTGRYRSQHRQDLKLTLEALIGGR